VRENICVCPTWWQEFSKLNHFICTLGLGKEKRLAEEIHRKMWLGGGGREVQHSS
jgi:hypothetical protein